MIRSIKRTFHATPLHVQTMYIPLSFFVAFVLYYIIRRLFIADIGMSIIHSSTTLTMLRYSLIGFLGEISYRLLFGFLFFLLYVSIVYVVWMFLSNRYIRNTKEKHLETLFADILSVARGGTREVRTNDPSLTNVALAVNTIVQNAEQAMEDERHVEQTKNELITNVSHDLRTPLTSIIGYLTIIEEDKYRDEVELRRYTHIAFEKALQMERLISELFDYTRMQDRHFVVEQGDVNIQEMISQIVVQQAIQMDAYGVIVREEIPQAEIVLQGDGEKLARMFDNLLINAMKHGHAGTYIDIQVITDETFVIISLTNYGEPIPRIDVPHLFDRFYRGDKSRTQTTDGSGLGLAIVKSIVDIHGGSIDVVSTYEGTTFTVHLPK